uniref:Uncharacterized protein n=1 Tax=Anguilla anguilla TaxID=7936 RepID=A0A0E9QD27_ANGAN
MESNLTALSSTTSRQCCASLRGLIPLLQLISSPNHCKESELYRLHFC